MAHQCFFTESCGALGVRVREFRPDQTIRPVTPLSLQSMATQNALRSHGSGRTLPEWVAWAHGEGMVDITEAPPGVDPKPGNAPSFCPPTKIISFFS